LDYYKIISISRPILARANIGLDFVSGQYGNAHILICKYHFERIPGNIPCAYVSVESEIIRYIKYHVNPETDTMVMGYHEHIWLPNAERILIVFITYLVQIKAFLYDQYDRK
jgi:hypothetical protein